MVVCVCVCVCVCVLRKLCDLVLIYCTHWLSLSFLMICSGFMMTDYYHCIISRVWLGQSGTTTGNDFYSHSDYCHTITDIHTHMHIHTHTQTRVWTFQRGLFVHVVGHTHPHMQTHSLSLSLSRLTRPHVCVLGTHWCMCIRNTLVDQSLQKEISHFLEVFWIADCPMKTQCFAVNKRHTKERIAFDWSVCLLPLHHLESPQVRARSLFRLR